ncbi:metallophosphoesterase [Cryobacterium sp. N19]|uniref:metallophosphoesterase n=1 Tax=Cryobacterium sp. N19 TaxID=2048288 RepID=UPI000CE2E397|nr:metallophosphoesterase [Cryobacterium sp. N19]
MDLTLQGETRVAVAGDWHGNISWVQTIIPAIARTAPDVRTILHVGDFGIWPERSGKGFPASVDFWCKNAGIERLLVTPGNHEDWDRLDGWFAGAPGQPVQISDVVWVLPRALRFSLGGATYMSFGGAASVDYELREPGKEWWLTEIPTDDDVAAAIAGGPVDVLITHETVNGGTAATERALRTNPMRWSAEALTYSALSRARVTLVWEAVKPQVLVHGHMHTADQLTLPDGRRIYSLGCDNQAGNVGLLDLATLAWSDALAGETRPRARRTRNVEALYLTRPGEETE